MRAALTGVFGKALLKAPVHAYRWTLKPLIGHECRHLPSCSAYALDAIDLNGAWRGGWLAASRLCRCHPWGTSGLDLAPDIREEHHGLQPWRYGRWRTVTPVARSAPETAQALGRPRHS